MNKKHALIIGGTRGIGRALVQSMAREGYVVSVIGRKIPSVEKHLSNDTKYWSVDLHNRKKLSSILSEIIHKNGLLTNLICLQRYRDNGDDWTGEIEITLSATKYLIENLSEKFDSSHDSSIVLASSIASQYVVDSQPLSYHIAKAGIDQMIRYYAVVLGSKGIRVNGVATGTILKEESKEFFLQNKHLFELYCSVSPLKRMGSAEEIAQVIMFLCNSESSFITGQTIVADGGFTARWQESVMLNVKDMLEGKRKCQ